MFIWLSLPMILLCMPRIAKRVNFSESCSAVWILLKRSASAGTLKSMKTKLYFCHRFRPPEVHLTSKRWDIPFVNYVKHLSVIFDKKIAWRFHIEMIQPKAFRTFIRGSSLFKSERLNANIKLTLRKTLISWVMTYACPAWEFAADIHL
jgi:hypothetical protein